MTDWEPSSQREQAVPTLSPKHKMQDGNKQIEKLMKVVLIFDGSGSSSRQEKFVEIPPPSPANPTIQAYIDGLVEFLFQARASLTYHVVNGTDERESKDMRVAPRSSATQEQHRVNVVRRQGANHQRSAQRARNAPAARRRHLKFQCRSNISGHICPHVGRASTRCKSVGELSLSSQFLKTQSNSYS